VIPKMRLAFLYLFDSICQGAKRKSLDYKVVASGYAMQGELVDIAVFFFLCICVVYVYQREKNGGESLMKALPFLFFVLS